MCVSGLQCVGSKQHKVCKRPMAVGQVCKTDPYWECEPGVTCHKNICTARLPPKADCTAEGSLCQDRLLCVGPRRRLLCKRPMPVGKPCKVDPWWMYQPGVHCTNNVYVAGPNTVKRGQRCAALRMVCEEGTVCAGHSRWKWCVVPRGRNQFCRPDSRFVCGDGLRCFRRRCMAGRSAGQYCRENSRYMCADALRCVWKWCRETVFEGADCRSKSVECEDGTKCKGN